MMELLIAVVSAAVAVLLWDRLPALSKLRNASSLRELTEELQKQRAKLQEQEARLRSMGDSLPDSFLYQYTVENDEPKFIYVSSGIECLCGISVDRVMLDSMLLLGQIDPSQRESYVEAQSISQRDLSDFSMDLHMLRANGEWRWLRVRSHPRKNENGSVVWDGIATDVTDRLLYEAEINRLAQAVEQNPTGILIVDTQGVVEYMNTACTLISGYQFSEVYSSKQTHREIISTEMTDAEYGAIQTQLQAGRMWRGVLRNRHKSGRIYWEALTISPIYDSEGRVASYLHLRQDVNEQKNAEADLALRSAELERANADLTRFADVSAHHLMEPTRRLISYSQQLRKQVASLPEACRDQEVTASLAYIEHDAGHLRTLVRDIQLYLSAGMPRGEVRMEDSDTILEMLQQRLAEKLALHHIHLEISPLPGVMLDRPRLIDLFALLLDNAIRHGQSGEVGVDSCIAVSGERDKGLSRFRIRDNGNGIPTEYLERVFEIFERLNVVNGEGGTGIGLSIARRIVESRHGRIWIENRPEGGAMVVFELPDEN